MKLTIIFGLIIVFLSAYASANCDTAYIEVGAGYKFHESTVVTYKGNPYDVDINNSPISARLELGVSCENFNFGITHRSQWLTGYPFNDQKEYQVNEVFIEYKYEWSL